MGLTASSSGRGAIDFGFQIKKRSENDLTVALAGNPNVGKSTLFNALTGMNQHTGNWPGKTVACAVGHRRGKDRSYIFVDIPGTYSLAARSCEEEVARNFICFGAPDVIVAVCDATCLERNLNLILQILEVSDKVVVCVNLLDEARRKGIRIDLDLLSARLGVEVVGVVARKKKTLGALLSAIDRTAQKKERTPPLCSPLYPDALERAARLLASTLPIGTGSESYTRQLALKLIEGDADFASEAAARLGGGLASSEVSAAIERARGLLLESGIDGDRLRELIASSLVRTAEEVCEGVVRIEDLAYANRDRKIDRILTGKITAYPFMICLLALVFWITISGANYPSSLLSDLLFSFEGALMDGLSFIGTPLPVAECIVFGIYRVLAWVVSVMLPPMAIFFPLFTILEDIGYLPRVAYNLDRPFKACSACGKQALTMCMGFGCNAAGVVGCRIIDSPRERALAVITNALVPCNGRFPALITMIAIFLVSSSGGALSSVASAALLTLIIIFSVLITLGATKFLSLTFLRGAPSSFTLEMPPFRRPQIGKIIVRSLLDRTLFVLLRAVAFSAPAGLLIWLLANVQAGDVSLLSHASSFLDPVARLLGLDGVILLAFILGFPANEIVLPIIIMAYAAEGALTELQSAEQIRALLVSNGWSAATALSFITFSLFHWPCATTLMTVKKETGSLRQTLASAALPTAIGALLCILINAVSLVFGA